MKKVILLIVSCLMTVHLQARSVFFADGKSGYTIVVASGASSSEKAAAQEFRDYVRQVSGAQLAISNNLNTAGKRVFIGWNSRVAALTGKPQPKDNDEGFTYMTAGDDLFIFGGRKMGTAYGVFSFLEQQLGIHWYTKDFTKIPQIKSYTLPDLNRSETPAIRSRHVMYYQTERDFDLATHNLLNAHSGLMKDPKGRYEQLSALWGAHTFSALVSPDKYFASHPEYYSLRSGKRVKDGQLCLSNGNVIRIMTESLKEKIKQAPGYFAYSVTPNDNNNYCECKACTKIANRYGGQSGLLIWAVNQVAAEVAKTYPDAMVATFAYHYTRQAPKNIQVADNVVIRLCDIECCALHPVADKESQSYMTDYQAWAKLTNNIYIWDYVTSFVQYLTPLPIYHAIQKDIQMYAGHDIMGIMEEGQYDSEGGEFAELKQWLLAKLLWNPNQDVDSLAEMFIKDYYGAASGEIWNYYKLLNSLVRPAVHSKYSITQNSELFTESFISEADNLLKQAVKKASKDAAVLDRVKDVRMQILFLKVIRKGAAYKQGSDYKEFRQLINRRQIKLKEGQDSEKFLKTFGF